MYKQNSQPLNTKNAGCIFKNPRGLSAGALIDQAGLKGMRVGGAEVSAKHANFIIAHPGCRADDVLKLDQDHPGKGLREKPDPSGERSADLAVKQWAELAVASRGSVLVDRTVVCISAAQLGDSHTGDGPASMRVTVLYGGPSAEREVSLVSGTGGDRRACKSMGHDVFAIGRLADRPVGPGPAAPTSSFPVLHGAVRRERRAAGDPRAARAAVRRLAGRKRRGWGWTRSRPSGPGKPPACRRRLSASSSAATPIPDASPAPASSRRSTAAAASTSCSARPPPRPRRGHGRRSWTCSPATNASWSNSSSAARS